MTTNAAGFYVSIMALMMAMRGAPPMIGPSAIGAVNSALLLEDSVAWQRPPPWQTKPARR